jgi:hypothetical protein
MGPLFFNSVNPDSDKMNIKKAPWLFCFGAFFVQGAWDAPYALKNEKISLNIWHNNWNRLIFVPTINGKIFIQS